MSRLISEIEKYDQGWFVYDVTGDELVLKINGGKNTIRYVRTDIHEFDVYENDKFLYNFNLSKRDIKLLVEFLAKA